jgi:16S rRNA (cytosine967-C5)-methyltransferase
VSRNERPSPRRIALDALLRIDHDGAYANLVLPPSLGRPDLSVRDRGFITELVYGTTRMRRACDFLVDRFCVREPSNELRSILRLGAYQIHFMEVPAHAAVAETVELAPKSARGFVNAVLRKVSTAPVRWPDDATRLSYPDWIVERLRRELGDDDADVALAYMNTPPQRTERGDGYVQDLASQWVARLVDVEPGMRVLDVCAAPGGKATAMAAAGASVIAADRQLPRVQLIAQNATRLGRPVGLVAADGRVPPFRPGSFDRVLVDAPCSGLGTLRRRPDARWHIEEADLANLIAIQADILAAARPLVRPGGLLVYSVCTLTDAEAVDHDRPEWEAIEIPDAPWRPYGRGVRLYPQDVDTDGMSLFRWRVS